MDEKIDDGGQAFPVAGMSELPNGEFLHPTAGMSLRDYFAAKALGGILASPNCPKIVNEKLVADGAYLFADAMLKARGPA